MPVGRVIVPTAEDSRSHKHGSCDQPMLENYRTRDEKDDTPRRRRLSDQAVRPTVRDREMSGASQHSGGRRQACHVGETGGMAGWTYAVEVDGVCVYKCDQAGAVVVYVYDLRPAATEALPGCCLFTRAKRKNFLHSPYPSSLFLC